MYAITNIDHYEEIESIEVVKVTHTVEVNMNKISYCIEIMAQ